MGRRTLAVVSVVAAVALLSSSAGAVPSVGGWVISTWSKNTFSGKFTNLTHSPINGVAVGTALKEGNPITAFDIENLKCQLYAAYGSAYCYVSLLIQPGATVLFHGSSKDALTPAGLQMCTSADKGMDNTCVNVPLSSKKSSVTDVVTTTASPGVVVKVEAVKKAAARARLWVGWAIEDEQKALESLDPQVVGEALDTSRKYLKLALTLGFHDTIAEGQIQDAIRDDTHALDSLNENGSGAMATVDRFVKSAISHKNAAKQLLTSLAR